VQISDDFVTALGELLFGVAQRGVADPAQGEFFAAVAPDLGRAAVIAVAVELDSDSLLAP